MTKKEESLKEAQNKLQQAEGSKGASADLQVQIDTLQKKEAEARESEANLRKALEEANNK